MLLALRRRIILSISNRVGGRRRDRPFKNNINKKFLFIVNCRRSYQSKPENATDDKAKIITNENLKKIQHIQSFTLPPGSDPNADYTGLSIWGSAEPLLNYLVQKYFDTTSDGGNAIRPPKRHLRILELGSGCGKVGLGLAAAAVATVNEGCCSIGAKVVLTDHLEVMLHLHRNVNLNQHIIYQNQILVRPLTWGSKEHIDNLKKEIHDAWADDDDDDHHDNNTFDLIVGSDLLYNPNSHTSLIETLQTFTTTDTEVYLGYPSHRDNKSSSSSEQIFLNFCQSYFDVSIEPLQQQSSRGDDGSHNNMTTTTKSMVAILKRKP